MNLEYIHASEVTRSLNYHCLEGISLLWNDWIYSTYRIKYTENLYDVVFSENSVLLKNH